MKQIEYLDGQVIFKQGEITGQMYVVEAGAVAIYRNYGSAQERFLAELGVGKSFAETAVVSSRPRTVTAVARGEVRVRAYTSAEFDALQSDYPDMALNIIRDLSERLRHTTDELMEACRTIAESMDEKELKNNKGLRNRLKKFAAMYDEACKENYDPDIAESAAKAVSAYNNFGTTITKR